MKPALRASLSIALSLTVAAPATMLAGCSKDQGLVVVTEQQASEETTGGMTPLERGVLRRTILDYTQSGLDAWTSNDVEGMAEFFDDASMKQFQETWKKYEKQGLTVQHVHDLIWLDVTEINKAGTQAIVNYRYDDKSYLVDADGNRVKKLDPIKETEAQLTLEKQDDGTWKVVRMLSAANTYR